MGPLHDVKVIEVASIGPGPFTAMLLADMGAEVVRVDRVHPRPGPHPPPEVLHRGRRSVAIDLKHPRGVETLLRLVEQADILIEGFRPGTMERLGLGPDECRARNPRLVYGRMTGWGQTGPLAAAPGHDINFIALSGALAGVARVGERPVPPLTLVGDFGGGGLLQAFGVVSALVEARGSGAGQVVDTAMLDGASLLMTMVYALRAMGLWNDQPGTNLLDSGAHFYDTYETADGRYIAVGPLEPHYYAELLRRLGLADEDLPDQLDRSRWPEMKERFASVFKTRTRDEWCELLEGTDACVSPVLTLEEAPNHPHNRARSTFLERDGVVQPAPAPRFSRTPPAVAGPPPRPGEHTDDVLLAWAHTADEVAELRRLGAVA
jgi:alpha-methylacyl-CoA racemase